MKATVRCQLALVAALALLVHVGASPYEVDIRRLDEAVMTSPEASRLRGNKADMEDAVGEARCALLENLLLGRGGLSDATLRQLAAQACRKVRNRRRVGGKTATYISLTHAGAISSGEGTEYFPAALTVPAREPEKWTSLFRRVRNLGLGVLAGLALVVVILAPTLYSLYEDRKLARRIESLCEQELPVGTVAESAIGSSRRIKATDSRKSVVDAKVVSAAWSPPPVLTCMSGTKDAPQGTSPIAIASSAPSCAPTETSQPTWSNAAPDCSQAAAPEHVYIGVARHG